MTNPPPPPRALCLACPRFGRRGTKASYTNCRAYDTCFIFEERYGEKPQRKYTLTRRDLVDRAIGWTAFGVIIGALIARYT